MGSLFDMPDDSAPTIEAPCEDRSYTVATSPAEAAKVVARLAKSPAIGMALYAVGEEAMTARWEGIALSAKPCEAFYIPLGDGAARSEILAVIEPLFTGSGNPRQPRCQARLSTPEKRRNRPVSPLL